MSADFTPTIQGTPAQAPPASQHLKTPSNNSWRRWLAVLILFFGGVLVCAVAVVSGPAPAKSAALPAPAAGTPAKANVALSVPDKVEAPLPKKNTEALDTRRNWRRYILAAHSSYAYGVIGGISNLSILFTNRSNYRLEEVTARVTVIKANGKPWKSRLVTVRGLGAHSEASQVLPKMNRGKSVEVKIVKVVSKGMEFSYEEGKAGKDPTDPYFKPSAVNVP